MAKKILSIVAGGLLLGSVLVGCASSLEHQRGQNRAADDAFSPLAAYHYSVSVLLRRDGDLPGAIDELKQALGHDSGSSYLVTELVSLYVENNDTEKALSLGEESLARSPENMELRSIMGGLFFSTQAYDKAAREYKTIIAGDPKNLVAHLYLATIYAQEKKYDQAESAYRKLLEIDPENIIGMYYYAKTLMEMQRWADAEALLQKRLRKGRLSRRRGRGWEISTKPQTRYDDAIVLYRRYLTKPGTGQLSVKDC